MFDRNKITDFDVKKFQTECQNVRAEVFGEPSIELLNPTTAILQSIQELNAILVKNKELNHLSDSAVEALNSTLAELSKALVQVHSLKRLVTVNL